MAATYQAGSVESLYDAASNNSSDFSTPEAITAPHLSLLQTLSDNKLGVALALFAIFVLAQLLNRKKLPKGVKPLPILPGLPWAGRFWCG